MSADAPVEAAASSEVLDLNADAAAIDGQEHARGNVADGARPIATEALTEPSMGSGGFAEEGLNGEGRSATEDGRREAVAEAGDADANDRPPVDVVTGGREASEGMADRGGDVGGEDCGSGLSAEAKVCHNTGIEIIEGTTEVAMECVGGTGKEKDNISLGTENKMIEGGTESNGGKCLPEVFHVVQETSGLNVDIPEGSEVEMNDGKIHLHSLPANEKVHSGDVAPDLNSAVDVVQSVESENISPQPVVEKLRDQGDDVVEDVVTDVKTSEVQDENTYTACETTEMKGHIVTENSAPASEITLLPTSETSEDQSCRCPIQIEAHSDIIGDRGQKMGEKHDAYPGSEKPASGGDSGAVDPNLSVPVLDQSCDPGVALIKVGCDISQVGMPYTPLSNEDKKVNEHCEGTIVTDDKLMDMSGSSSVAEECLPESSQLGQKFSNVPKQDSSEVHVSAGPFPSVNQSIEIQYVGSLLNGNQNFPPSPEAGQDDSPSTIANLEMEHESIKADISPSKVVHGQEVKLNEKEDDGVNLPSDLMEVEITGANTSGDQVELNMPELLEKGDEFLKCSTINCGAVGMENNQCASYYLPQEDKSTLSVSDLVWGKVKSHPWWPGQIFESSNASDLALKHQKRDNFLVAYFGDKTFAWCEESKLKPFQKCFSLLGSQGTSDAFINAVNSALAEVSRRLELGMSCICVPEESINNLKHQKIENAGIREGSCCSVLDKSFGVNNFQPNNFLDYIKALALCPRSGTDRLELVIAKSQLMALNRLKGHTELPASYVRDGLLENDAVTLPPRRGRGRPRKSSGEHLSPSSKNEGHTELPASHVREGLLEKDVVTPPPRRGRGRPRKSLGEYVSPTSTNEKKVASDLSPGKRKKALGSTLHGQKQIPEHGRKEKSLSELMDDKKHSNLVNGDGTAAEMRASAKFSTHSSGKKRKNDDSTFPYSGKNKKKRLDALGDLEKKTPILDRSFKVGECISRVASKLTGSPSIIKSNGESLRKCCTGKADQGSPQVFDISSQTPENTRRTRKCTLKNYYSPEEMLSQLCLAAMDPMKGHSFLSAIVSFFSEVRELRDSSFVTEKPYKKIRRKRGRKKKSESNDSNAATDKKSSEKIGRKRGRKKKSESGNDSKTDMTEASTPDYMADSYWTDRVLCSNPDEKPVSSRRKRKGELMMQSTTKRIKPSPESLPLSKMMEAAHHLRISAVSPTANRDSAIEKQATFFGEKCLEESSPTALILSFSEPDALPSETNLIRIFSRYGPLQEAETEVLNETNCAKVVFKRRADAEVAFSSAGKYCIFGPALVSYRLRYLPSTPVASIENRSDGRKDSEISDGVNLAIPAQEEVGGLAEEEVKELAQEKLEESVQDKTEKLTREEVESTQDDSAKEEAKELAQQEVNCLAQEQVEKLAQDESKEFTQNEAKEIAQDELKELTQDEAKEKAQDESKGSTQDEADEMKELTQAEAKE